MRMFFRFKMKAETTRDISSFDLFIFLHHLRLWDTQEFGRIK